MPENPFTKFQKYVDRPGRHSNDNSYDVNGTYRIGTIYPVGIWEVNPGDSVRIKSAVGLKFVPMPYPIQTRLHVTFNYHYVRLRNLCDDFQDFIYQNKDKSVIPAPTIVRKATDREFWKTGGLADHLGVPTTIAKKGRTGQVLVPVRGVPYSNSSSILESVSTSASASTVNLYLYNNRPFLIHTVEIPFDLISGASIPPIGVEFEDCLMANLDIVTAMYPRYAASNTFGYAYRTGVFYQPLERQVNNGSVLTFLNSQLVAGVSSSDQRQVGCMVFAGDPSVARNYQESGDSLSSKDPMMKFQCVFTSGSSSGYPIVGSGSSYQVTLDSDVLDAIDGVVANGQCYFLVIFESFIERNKHEVPLFGGMFSLMRPSNGNLGSLVQASVFGSSIVDIADYPESNIFAPHGDVPPVLPISAYPFRVYEAIYNAWYRNERLEPLMVNGQPEYNKFCPNTSSGEDPFDYMLYQRNWESDFLTSALPAPQQGVAPVVGVTGLSTIQLDDDGTIRNFKAEVAEDGETITGGSFTEPGASSGARRTVADMITAGFTINDLRNVSALQRWVENNIRRGLKYKDQVMANTGVKVRFDELDMPEFIGGFSRPVQVSAITQTAPGGDVGVGDYTGQANLFGESKHSITHYCDEAGFVMCTMCIVPEPVYSQLLPKYFLKQSPLDYFHPAFNHIGMQPISYREVAPLQVFANNPSQDPDAGITLNDIFGYQRPWYDLLARVNEVHGLMRTEMRDYVMNRTFDDTPELGADFVHIDPEQINDVFSVNLPDKDVCMGQIIHQCYIKRQVSLFGQPKIQ